MEQEWRRSQFLLGIEGLGLLRQWLTGDASLIEPRIGEIEDLCARFLESRTDDIMRVSEGDVARGYDALSAAYDHVPNGLLLVEAPLVRALIEELPQGRVLDAACGTGRHTGHLVSAGHFVVGVDRSEGMLREARTKAPEALLAKGDLEMLPVVSESFDAAICCLALTHLPRLEVAVGELARVVRPGGEMVLSDIHPFAAATGAHIVVHLGVGRFTLVRNHVHPHSRYLSAFRKHGLQVIDCVEPEFDVNRHGEPGGVTDELRAATEMALNGLPFALIWHLRRQTSARD